MKYVNRINALEDDIVYSLSIEGVNKEGHVDTVRFESITSICLSYAPSRYYSNIFQCKIIHASGEILLSNRRYIELATFEYQSDLYAEFVKALHEKVGEHTQLKSGLNSIRYWIELPLSIALFSLIFGVIFNFGHPLLALLFLLILAVRLVPYYRKNYPQSYSKGQIPEHILPKR